MLTIFLIMADGGDAWAFLPTAGALLPRLDGRLQVGVGAPAKAPPVEALLV